MSLVGPSAVVAAVVRKLMNIKWIVELVALGWHLALGGGGLSPPCFVPSLSILSLLGRIFLYRPLHLFGEASYAAFSLFPSCALDLTAWKKTPERNQLEPVAEQQLKATEGSSRASPQSDGPGYEGELH